jgi:signal peptidase I
LETFQPTGERPTQPRTPAVAPENLTIPDLTALPEFPAAADFPAEQKSNWKQFVLDLVETLLLAVVLYFGINALSARVRVDGFSMNPTLQDGEYVLVSKISYFVGEPQRGDIIVFQFPGPSEQDLIKRIVGLPGDVVEVRAGQVYVNGQAVEEAYIAAKPLYEGQWQVPPDSLFVLGDNRNDSSDSHSWGMLPLDHVIGKAILIYWPPPEWNLINHADLVVVGASATVTP